MKKITIIAVVALTAIGVGGTALARTLQYRAEPVGELEVPTPVDSTASGDLKVKVSEDGQSARYDLKVKGGIDDAFMAHLHLGAAGENGPIVVWLFPHDGPPPAQPTGDDFSGRLAKDVITPEDLVGPLTGDWTGFLAALDAGDLYVNIHTLDNPGGEIRDQVIAHPGG